MDKEISSTKDKPNYLLSIMYLLLPTVVCLWGSFVNGEFVAVDCYVLSYGGSNFPFSDLATTFIWFLWFIGGIASLCTAIASLLIRKGSRRKRIVALCALAGYVFAFTWSYNNPTERQIKRAFYNNIPINSAPMQVVQILQSKHISYDDKTKDKGIIYAYIPENWRNVHPYTVTFHFIHNKFNNLTVEQQPGLYNLSE